MNYIYIYNLECLRIIWNYENILQLNIICYPYLMSQKANAKSLSTHKTIINFSKQNLARLVNVKEHYQYYYLDIFHTTKTSLSQLSLFGMIYIYFLRCDLFYLIFDYYKSVTERLFSRTVISQVFLVSLLTSVTWIA